MAKYNRKNLSVEAEQYFHGKECKGVKVTVPEILFSRDGTYFYVTHTDGRDWLSVDKKEDGKYDALPFAFYEVKSGERKSLDSHPELVKLYLDAFQIKPPQPYARIDRGAAKESIEVQEGDWIVYDSEQEKYSAFKPDIFEKLFEPAE